MGVMHLYTFIKKQMNNGFVPVNVSEEINEFRRKNPGIQPVIIVDLIAFHKIVYKEDEEILVGGRYNVYNENMLKFLMKFQSLGAKIIYFFDGSTQTDKVERVLERRSQNYNEIFKIFDAIDNDIDLNRISKICKVDDLMTFFKNITNMAKSIGEVYMSVLNECDQEMVKLANEKNALAIISNDTDFLIYEGKWKMWSAYDFNRQNMTTFEFKKDALREKLGLSSKQMTLLGTLAGNDIVLYETVENYHKRLAPRGGKFYKIAHEVSNNVRSSPPTLRDNDEDFLVRRVFKPEDRVEGRKNLRKSLNIYCLINMRKNFRNNVLQEVATKYTRLNYDILSGTDFFVNIGYSELKTRIFMPYYDLIRQIMRRIMGILLKDQQNLKPKRRIYTKLKHETPYELIVEMPEYPTLNVPPILQLLCQPYDLDHHFNRIRLDLFVWIISSKLNSNIIEQLPKDNFLTVLSIFYLIDKKQISVKEGDCILIASNCPPNIRDSLDLNDVKTIDGRDARLAFLFPKIFNLIHDALLAVGLDTFTNLITFDGLYFHILRKECKANQNYLNNLIVPYEKLRIYKNLTD